MATPTTSARLDEYTERRVAEIVKRQGITRSDWLREAVDAAIKAETDGADQAATLVDISQRLTTLERYVCEATDQNLRAINTLSTTLAIEQAADRAVTQQIYRMAFRAAYLVVKQFTDEVPEEQRDDLGMRLCAESDDLCNDIGLARVDQVMREAREEFRQSIEQGGAS